MRPESQVHSVLDSRDYGKIVGELAKGFSDGFGMDEVRDLEAFGIKFSAGTLKGMSHIAQQMTGMDDASTIQGLITTASVITPIQFLQNWLPGFVKIIFAARKIDEIVPMTTVGSWEDEEIVQPVMEMTGAAQPYGDTTNSPLANYNVNFNARTVERFEQAIRVGTLEEVRAARIRVNSGESKREAAALSLEIQRNQLGFYGYNSGNNNTYGLLNDPALPAYIEVAANGSSQTQWVDKTYLQIVADLLTAIVGVRTQAAGNIDTKKTPMTLVLPTNAIDYLSTSTDFGITVRNWLESNYPNIRVVDCVQFEAAHASLGVFYLYVDRLEDTSTDDGRTFIQVVPAKFQVLGVQKLTKGYEEAYSNATAGIMTKRPYLVYRAYGIS